MHMSSSDSRMGSSPSPAHGFDPQNIHFKLTMKFISLFTYFCRNISSITSKYYFPNISSIPTGPPAFFTFLNNLVTPATSNLVSKEVTEWRWSIFAHVIISKLSKNWWIFLQKIALRSQQKCAKKQNKIHILMLKLLQLVGYY